MLAATLASALALAFAPAPAALDAVAGGPVSCVDDAAWAVSFPAPVAAARGLYDTVNHAIYLRSAECERLQLLLAGARPSSVWHQYDFASALFLFAHELAHARGVDDEGQADCAAGRSFLRLAAALGVGPGYARVLAGYLVNARIAPDCYPS